MKKAGFLVAAVCFLWGGSVFAELSGSGTEAEPYLIGSLADFDEFAADPNYWAQGVHTKLMSDVDLGGKTYVRAVIAPDISNVEDGFQGLNFSGVFLGNGHRIINLTANTLSDSDTTNDNNDSIALFGRLDARSTIERLGVEDASVVTGGDDSEFLGVLCARNLGSIHNCYVTGNIQGGDSCGPVGGVCGSNGGI